ncbi:MAG: rRNA maturation RNase YbeY [Phycisphaeraceae bacterium]
MSPAEPTTQDQPDNPGPDEPDSSASNSGGSAAEIHVEVVAHTDVAGVPIDRWLDHHVCRAIELCEVKQAQLNLVIVADEEMAELHEQYTGVAGTTDVLTFDLTENTAAAPAEGGSPPGSNDPRPGSNDPPSNPTTIEADIILCLDEAKRQAADRGHEPRQELLLYAIHGLMHLLGEDDHNDDDYQRMHAREDALLQQLGFGPLFDPDR